MRSPLFSGSASAVTSQRFGCLLIWIIHGWHVSRSFAVDRSKFRTCQQTSFCRRHRDGRSAKFYNYELLPESLEFLAGATDPKAGETEGGDVAAPAAAAPSTWGSWSRRLLFGESSGDAAAGSDPYVRGIDPVVTGVLVNRPTDDPQEEERLRLALYALADGTVRMRVTEMYGIPGTAYEQPRVTYDDLVLETAVNNVEWKPAAHVAWKHPAEADDKTWLERLVKLVSNAAEESSSVDLYRALENGDDAAVGTVMLLRLRPFSVYLFRSNNIDAGPVVQLNTESLLSFEVRRYASDTKQRAARAAAAAAAKRQEKKHDKEIVGYWEDGLAIYADGTREEKQEIPEEEEEEDEEHRKLSDSDRDTRGMWEESFSSHVDSKPFGPMSVGVDLIFPNSHNLYGIPEHAAKAQLQPTIGGGAHFREPYRLYNLDVFEYELDETMALYGEVPFVISHSTHTETTGVFWFNPTETFVDVRQPTTAEAGTTTHWMSESGVIDIFFLPGPDPETLYRQYATLTGTTPQPPMFSLGYHQCRWNYKDEKDVYQVHGKFEELDYPYDVLWLDIEHTDGKRYFTWDKRLFPNPKTMQETLAKQGRRMVTIIDPHIKQDNNYYIHREAAAKGLYIKKNDGKTDYDGWCWPGSSMYLDFTDEKVRRWWAEQFKFSKYKESTPTLFTWNDMNEPSVFNGPEVSMQKDLQNLRGDEHREWHNLYGMLFHRATGEGQVLRSPGNNVRPFVLSRAFFAGSQRYGAIWTGDNKADWSHLEIATPMLLSLNSAALSFVGADVGGFFGNPDAELFTRWMQAGAYQPFFRGHAHHDSKRREPWMFDDETLVRLRTAAMVRYALLPFWYTVFHIAETTGMPVMRMMWMEYPKTEVLFSEEAQYMIGSELLVRPITSFGVSEAEVSFPSRDVWYDVETMVKVADESLDANGVLVRTVPADIDTIPVFQRGGSVIPRKLRLRRSSEMMKTDPYTLYFALDRDLKASGILYMDDEETFDYLRREDFAVATFTADLGKLQNAVISNSCRLGTGWSSQVETLASDRMIERIVLMGVGASLQKLQSVTLNGSAALDFTFNAEKEVLVIRKPEVSALQEWSMVLAF